jgi:glycosyltransferase involved in cell wall biosynthesis
MLLDAHLSPLVSIGIPTYNRPNGLKRTLSALLQQSYTNIEIIVSDNGSPQKEEIRQIVTDFQDSRIQLTQHPVNQGVFFNFQYVLSVAKGEFFMWAADDDDWDRDFISKLVPLLLEDTTKIVAVPFVRYYKVNHILDDKKEEILLNTQEYHLLEYLASATSTYSRCKHYLTSRDNINKANIIYGIFRRTHIQTIFNDWFDANYYPFTSSDELLMFMAMNCGGLAHYNGYLRSVYVHTDSESSKQEYSETKLLHTNSILHEIITKNTTLTLIEKLYLHLLVIRRAYLMRRSFFKYKLGAFLEKIHLLQLYRKYIKKLLFTAL